MTEQILSKMKQWPIKDLRECIDTARLAIKGKSKDDLISKLRTELTSQQIQEIYAQFAQKTKKPQKSLQVQQQLEPGPKSGDQKFSDLQALERRFKTIEQQIAALFHRMNKIEGTLLEINRHDLSSPSKDLKKAILQLIPPGFSMTVDDLFNHGNINVLPDVVVERAILELIDEEQLVAAEGNSQKKLSAYIGRLIRR